ncbi:unnamed protein product [Symbiodinium sp. CCMP2592]|nr:unnamed protein product [Symbiodinium sp. CCMP2592]
MRALVVVLFPARVRLHLGVPLLVDVCACVRALVRLTPRHSRASSAGIQGRPVLTGMAGGVRKMQHQEPSDGIHILVKGLTGDMLLECRVPDHATMRDLEARLKEARPEWKFQYIALSYGDCILKRSHQVWKSADSGKLELTATASPFCCRTVFAILHDCFEVAINAPMSESEWEDVTITELPLDDLAGTHLYMMFRKEFGKAFADSPDIMFLNHLSMKTLAERITSRLTLLQESEPGGAA